jgi:hypothetical protein
MSDMTKEQARASAERQEFDAATAEERKVARDIGRFIAMRQPGISEQSVSLRSRLHLAGERAQVLWERIEAGMPLVTAVRILRESDNAWRKLTGDTPIDEVLRKRLADYDASGHVRRVGDRVYRTSGDVQSRAAAIAKGEKAPAHKARPKTAVREAIAAWIASNVPKNHSEKDRWVDECMAEVEVVLASFAKRFRATAPEKARLYAACDMLNIPRPKWGARADEVRAWKNRKAALASMHPDALGHDGAVGGFQAIKDAYDVIVAYNDNLPERGRANGSKETAQ